MGRVIDLTGQVFGMLTVIGVADKPDNATSWGQHWQCKCICGTIIVAIGTQMRRGKRNSCGCYILGNRMTEFDSEGIPTSKICGKCKQRKYMKEFGYRSKAIDRTASQCKSCLYLSGIQRRYNWSQAVYNKQYNKQEGFCAICGEKETARSQSGATKTLSIDHCHRSGKVRQLLCNNCNNLLGHSRDQIYILEAAIAYLRKHEDESD